jgi:hypothetical protein
VRQRAVPEGRNRSLAQRRSSTEKKLDAIGGPYLNHVRIRLNPKPQSEPIRSRSFICSQQVGDQLLFRERQQRTGQSGATDRRVGTDWFLS